MNKLNIKEKLSRVFGSKINSDLFLECEFICPKCNAKHSFIIHPYYKLGPKTFNVEELNACENINVTKANHDKKVVLVDDREIPYVVTSVTADGKKIY